MKQSPIAKGRQLRMKKVQKQFANWRKTKRTRGSKTPEHLWEAAVNLHDEYSAHEISKGLGIGYSEIKSLISQALKKKSTPAFIQMEIPARQSKQGAWSIEMENADGSKMKISGSGWQIPDVGSICQNFVESKR